LLRQQPQDRSYDGENGLDGQVSQGEPDGLGSTRVPRMVRGVGASKDASEVTKFGQLRQFGSGSPGRHDVVDRPVPVRGQLQETQAKRISVRQPLLATPRCVCVAC